MRQKISFFALAVTGCILFFNSSFQIQLKASESETIIEKPAAELSANNIPQPKIQFEQELLDFGKIGPGTRVEGQFKFTNAGNALLEISKVSQCCGVVTTLEKSKYEPGESGLIKVTYNGSLRTGSIIRQPIVYSNDPVDPNYILTIKADIVDKVIVNPTRLKLFFNDENAGCPKLTVSSTDGNEFSIRRFESTGNCITAEFDPNEKATEFVLEPKVNMGTLSQNMSGNINITIIHPQANLVTLPFNVVSKYTINPPLIIITNANPDEPVFRKIWIYNNYNETFEIESTSSKNNSFTVLNQSKVNDGYQLEIRITPPPQPSESKTSFSDEFYIQVKGSEKVTIKCNGYY